MSESKFRPLMLIILMIVCCLPVTYLIFFTEDRFISESQFSIVVEEDSNVEASMGILAMVAGPSSGSVDTQSAIGFIHSTDLLLEIEKEFNLVEHFTAPRNDIIFRLAQDPSLEERVEYYRKCINAVNDPATGLVHLTVETFNSQLSFDVSKKILEKTEFFINNLNKDVAKKRLNFAEIEVDRANEKIRSNEQALLKFQNDHKIIQPEAIIEAQLAAIQMLKLEKINREVALITIRTSAPNSPNIKSQEAAIDQLVKTIEAQEAILSGPGQQKLNQLLAQYKEIELNLNFAVELRKGAEMILEKTRVETISKSRFFSIIQNPYLSEESTNPRRWYLSITSVLVILLGFYIVRAIIVSIYDRV